MGAGAILFPTILWFFYIIPIAFFFYKKPKRLIRLIVLFIPILFTIICAVSMLIEIKKQEALYKKYPQVNKIIFNNSFNDVRDSILQLKILMKKLPKRLDHESISYSIDKYVTRLNNFSFNWFDLENLADLEKENNQYKYSGNQISDWNKYIGKDLRPFKSLSEAELKRFFKLIKYLDRNSLNGANIEDNIISFDYSDSLRRAKRTGFRTITNDTSGYYGPQFFDITDTRNGFFLLKKK